MMTRRQITNRGPLERRHAKYDVGPFRVGPFELVANYQLPPLDRRTRTITVAVVTGSVLFAIATTVALRLWIVSYHPLLGAVASGLTPAAILGSSFVALYVWGWLSFRPREKRLLAHLASLNSEEDRPARFTVRGRPSELLEFAAIRNDLFEPQTFYASHRSIGMRLEWRVLFTLLLVLIATLTVVSGATGRFWWLIYLVLPGLAYLIIRGLPVQPTYYRYVPGRMDCLRFRWFLPGKPRITSLDLRSARLRIDLTSQRDMIVVDIPPRLIALRRDSLPDPLDFALAIARFALSTATPPHLPMDALTG